MQETTDQFNELAEEFYEEDSEIEIVARECIAEDFGVIADEYGFEDADIEELIATRDWKKDEKTLSFFLIFTNLYFINYHLNDNENNLVDKKIFINKLALTLVKKTRKRLR